MAAADKTADSCPVCRPHRGKSESIESIQHNNKRHFRLVCLTEALPNIKRNSHVHAIIQRRHYSMLFTPQNIKMLMIKLSELAKQMSKLGATPTKGHGNDLIVDFGERRRLSQSSDNDCEDTESAAAATTTADKHVTFSEDVDIRSFQYPSEEELSQRWHSTEDKFLFKLELARDVRGIRHYLSTTPIEALEKEILYWCLGLEALVSSQVTRHVKEQRELHVRSIEEVQYRLDEDQLAVYAMRRSLQSRERAQNIAAGNWDILS